MYIIALIPARSGSKELKHKNIRPYKNIPLLAHSIQTALKSKYINDVYFSSDSKEYSDIALEYGAKITPLRPIEISDDLSPDIDTFKFLLDWFKKEGHQIPDLIVHLRPTYPNRHDDLLDETIKYFLKNGSSYDSLRTVIPFNKCPYKMYYIENDVLTPFISIHNDFIEPFNQARQNFKDAYIHNGCIDIIRTNIILDRNILSGKILPYIMNETDNNDIDSEKDFLLSEKKI